VAGHPPFGQGVVQPPPSWPSGGGRATPSGLGGGSAAPWVNRKFECLAQGAAEPPLGPLGVVQLPLDQPAWGWPNHPRPNGVAGHHLWGGSATPAYIYIFFGFFFFFFKCDRGILGIKRPNGLNCHNLKVFFLGGG
jgi:hypothetical protein